MPLQEGRQPVLVFALGGETYGVRLAAVREILEPEALDAVPRTPPVIRGLADVRGQVITALDLPAVLGLPEPPASRGYLMILEEPRSHLALWSPAEIGMQTLDLESLLPPPDADGGVCDGSVAGEGGGAVHLLSTEKVLLRCERDILRRFRLPS